MHELSLLWKSLQCSPYFYRSNPVALQWVALFQAITIRDFSKMASVATHLISNVDSASQFAYLLHTAMLGNILNNNPLQANRIWNQFSVAPEYRISRSADPKDLLAKLLIAHVRKGIEQLTLEGVAD